MSTNTPFTRVRNKAIPSNPSDRRPKPTNLSRRSIFRSLRSISKALPAFLAVAFTWTAAAQSSVRISWNQNPESNVNRYNVLVGSSRGNLSVVQTVSTPSATLSGLNPSATYYCAVQAVNTDNQISPRSSVISFTTRGTSAAPEIDVVMAAAEPVRLISGKSSANFGKASVGYGARRYFTITNTGGKVLIGLNIKLIGPDTANFAKTGRLAKVSLAPDESTTFWVTFKPKGKGKKSATLRITSNDADESNFQVSLLGTGVATPSIEVLTLTGKNLVDGKSIINRGRSPIRKSSGPVNIVIKNTGDAVLRNLTFEKSGRNPADFIATSPKIKTLKPGKSVKVKIAFKPWATGPRRARLSIKSNDRTHPSFDIILAGYGQPRSETKSALAGATSGTVTAAPVQSYAWTDGEKFRAVTIVKSSGETIAPRDIQVSSNLVDWFSGSRHTTVIKDNATVLKVRDNTPLGSGTKRYIRLRPGR